MKEVIVKVDLSSIIHELRVLIHEELCKGLEGWAAANPENDNKDRLLNTKEVCAYLKISRGTLVKLLKEKRLVASKPGNKWLFTQTAIGEYLKNRSN